MVEKKVGFAFSINDIIKKFETSLRNQPSEKQLDLASRILSQSSSGQVKMESLIAVIGSMFENKFKDGCKDSTELLMAIRAKNIQACIPKELRGDDIFRTILRIISILDAAKLESEIIEQEMWKNKIGKKPYQRLEELREINKMLKEQISLSSVQQKA